MTEKQYLMKFVEYRMSKNVFIKEAWIYLSKFDKKIVATQSDMTELFKSEWWF